MKLYNVICYKDGKRYCAMNDSPLTLEKAMELADKKNTRAAVSNGWTCYVEEAC